MSVLTRKLGFLPVWAWSLLGVGVVLVFFRAKASAAAPAAGQDTGQTPQLAAGDTSTTADQGSAPAGISPDLLDALLGLNSPLGQMLASLYGAKAGPSQIDQGTASTQGATSTPGQLQNASSVQGSSSTGSPFVAPSSPLAPAGSTDVVGAPGGGGSAVQVALSTGPSAAFSGTPSELGYSLGTSAGAVLADFASAPPPTVGLLSGETSKKTQTQYVNYHTASGVA